VILILIVVIIDKMGVKLSTFTKPHNKPILLDNNIMSDISKNLQEYLITFTNTVYHSLLDNIFKSNSSYITSNLNNTLFKLLMKDNSVNALLINYPDLITQYMSSTIIKTAEYISQCNNPNSFEISQNNIINAFNQTKCDICWMNYQKDENMFNHNQVLFNCGHSCCSNCTNQIVKSQNSSQNASRKFFNKNKCITFSCHICRTQLVRTNCKGSKSFLEKLSLKISDCCITDYLDKLLSIQKYLTFEKMFQFCDLFFFLPFAVNMNIDDFNVLFLEYINKNIGKMNENAIIIFAVRYYLIFKGNFHFKNILNENNEDININIFYSNSEINLDIMAKLISSPYLLYKFIYVLYIIENFEQNNEYVEYLNCNLTTFNISICYIFNKFKLCKVFELFNNKSKKRVLNTIIDKFELDQKTCMHFFALKSFFKDLLFSIKNQSIFSVAFKNTKNFYHLLLKQIQEREIITLKSGFIELQLPSQTNTSIFLCSFKNTEFYISANSLEESFLEAKFFLMLNVLKNNNNMTLDKTEIEKSSNEDYAIKQLNRFSIGINSFNTSFNASFNASSNSNETVFPEFTTHLSAF